jgi:hypothetical protein
MDAISVSSFETAVANGVFPCANRKSGTCQPCRGSAQAAFEARDRFDNRPLFSYFHQRVLPKPFRGPAVPGHDIVRQGVRYDVSRSTCR